MRFCKKCGKKIPSRTVFNGKEVSLSNRINCIDCNPIGERNIWRGKEVYRKKYNLSKTDARTRKILVPIEHICKTCGRIFKFKSRNIECTTCSSRRVRESKKNRALSILGGKCIVCGYNKCGAAISFHHINLDDKLLTLSANWSNSWKTLENELKKCVLLCCRCHAELHAGFISLPESPVTLPIQKKCSNPLTE